MYHHHLPAGLYLILTRMQMFLVPCREGLFYILQVDHI